MLILSRKIGESLVIDGRVIVKIIRTDGDTVKVGIEAPADIPVHRQEVYDEIQKANREAANRDSGNRVSLPQLPGMAKSKGQALPAPNPNRFSPATNQQHSKTV
jgi:carbon storage regulator